MCEEWLGEFDFDLAKFSVAFEALRGAFNAFLTFKTDFLPIDLDFVLVFVCTRELF
jgi:hypothetical protein